MMHSSPNLQIRIHLVDGSVTAFSQDDAGQILQLQDGFQPAQIFNQEHIVVADQNSHTCFPVPKITRIDFDSEPPARLVFPGSLVQAVELTEVEFEALTGNPIMREQWTHLGARDESVVMFMDAQMADGRAVLLTMEVNLEPSTGLPNLNAPLVSGSGLCFRMRNGGVAALNLSNLTRLTWFPGPHKPSAGAWPARFGHTARSPAFLPPVSPLPAGNHPFNFPVSRATPLPSKTE
jgi:hypothetical protein